MIPTQRWIRAGTACAIVDFLWACGQTKFMYGGSITRLWQGVASAPFGAGMLEQGYRAALLGVALHISVAFTWSAVFVFVLSPVPPVSKAVRWAGGALAVAAIYGPLIWTTMSLLVIPSMTHKAPVITNRWWIQFVGHMPFVGLPIVLGGRKGS